MSTQSLANKYRSTTFDDLVGQDHISHILKYQVSHHTRQANYLFFGPRGTGKTSSARLFAKAINCLTTTDGNPCNVCENCVAISNNATMDIMEIDAASHTGIDNIREEIIDKLMYRPSMLKKRITIIDEVHMLSKGAFNALLKTMEEPTEWMVFILATTELVKVPDTIISRCQLFNFKKIPSPLIIDRLSYIASQENITNNEQGLSMIADLSDGCMRDAVKYLDQISVMGEVNEENVAQFLGVVSETSIANLINQYANYQATQSQSDFSSLINSLEELSKQGVDLTMLPKQLMYYADRHFHENQQLYSDISTLASQLLSQSKRYPHPLLLYKTLLYTNTISLVENSSAISISPRLVKTSDTQHPIQETIISPTASSPELIQNNIQENQQENTIHLSSDFSSHSITVFWENSITLMSQSLKNLLSGQSELVQIENNVAKVIITNPLAKLTLKKKENQDTICSAITTTTGQTITSLELSFMTKEEYFSHQMES